MAPIPFYLRALPTPKAAFRKEHVQALKKQFLFDKKKKIMRGLIPFHKEPNYIALHTSGGIYNLAQM